MPDDNTITGYASPSLGGVGPWGPWYQSGEIITSGSEYQHITLDFSSVSDAPSDFTVEVHYYHDGSFVTEDYVIAGDGDVEIDVGGDASASTVSFRMQSSSIGQLIQVDPGTTLSIAPGTAPTGSPNDSTPDPTHPLPDHQTDERDDWGDAQHQASPLVIDLSSGHTGIELTAFDAATTTSFFDIDGTGFATQTAWVTGDTGLLCRDLNGNGKIDSVNELFGSSSVDGFSLLASLDSNGDHKIDQYDTAWSTLKIWTDTNGDGITQSGELHSLDDLGIKSIDLAGVAASTDTIEGNTISHTSTVTFDDNSTAAIDDAWLTHDSMNSYYNGNYTLDIDTMSMPELRGYGTISDLTIAMSMDSTLKGLVS
jgi:hypothetical protein